MQSRNEGCFYIVIKVDKSTGTPFPRTGLIAGKGHTFILANKDPLLFDFAGDYPYYFWRQLLPIL
jgi:hypothetical protein